MHKCKEKLIAFGNKQVILCERGNMYGYNDLIVDPRNLIWLKSKTNLVTMDITHCLQQPAQKMADGTIKAGGLRKLIPYMGKIAMALDVNGIFLEVHDRPNESKCDAPTQWPLNKLEWLLDNIMSLNPGKMDTSPLLRVSTQRADLSKKILCCIPARYNSTRLPGKPLLKINDKTIIHLVYEQALKTMVDEIIVLTDDKRIVDEVTSFNGNCAIINSDCLNGTERIIKYLNTIDHKKYEIIVNIQGDEPFINPLAVNKVINNYLNKNIVCSTLCFKTKNFEEIVSKSRGKVIVDKMNNILYCSRNVIPTSKNVAWPTNIIKNHYYNIHVGIFVYNKDYLLQHFLKENTENQLLEDIEWLKILEQGYTVNTVFFEELERGIDTIEDYNYLLENIYKNQ